MHNTILQNLYEKNFNKNKQTAIVRNISLYLYVLYFIPNIKLISDLKRVPELSQHSLSSIEDESRSVGGKNTLFINLLVYKIRSHNTEC